MELNFFIAQFVTGLRAGSFREALRNAGIQSSISQEKWTNKRLPPPKFKVFVSDADAERAKEVFSEFSR